MDDYTPEIHWAAERIAHRHGIPHDIWHANSHSPEFASIWTEATAAVNQQHHERLGF